MICAICGMEHGGDSIQALWDCRNALKTQLDQRDAEIARLRTKIVDVADGAMGLQPADMSTEALIDGIETAFHTMRIDTERMRQALELAFDDLRQSPKFIGYPDSYTGVKIKQALAATPPPSEKTSETGGGPRDDGPEQPLTSSSRQTEAPQESGTLRGDYERMAQEWWGTYPRTAADLAALLARVADEARVAGAEQAIIEFEEAHAEDCVRDAAEAKLATAVEALRREQGAGEVSACKRCVECRDQEHHWIGGMAEIRGDDVVLICKHCDATAPACIECMDDIAITDDALCFQCSEGEALEPGDLEDKLDRALAAARKEWP